MKLNRSGFTIIEMAVAASMALIVALAFTTYNRNIHHAKKRIVLVNTLLEKKMYFDKLLEEENTFKNTRDAVVNLGMGCLRERVSCETTQVAAGYNNALDRIVLYDSSPAPGVTVYDGRLAHTNGFTDSGAACTGFVESGPGNDECPFGYIVNWSVNTPSSYNGIRVTINVKLIFNPANGHPMKKVINTDPMAPLTAYDTSKTRAMDSLTQTAVPSCVQSGITLYDRAIYPFYLFDSAPVGGECLVQQRTCNNNNGTAELSGSYTFPTCVQNCYGEWTPCSQTCGGGTQTYRHKVEANTWGAACTVANNATQSCNPQACAAPQDCQGSWSTCSASCGGGTQNFTVSTPAANGGNACPTSPRMCNTQSCTFPVNCAGTWGACSVNCGGGTQNFTVITAPANGGTACPASPAACNTQACSAVIDCAGNWTTCSKSCGGGTKDFTVIQTSVNGGAACPVSPAVCNTQACAPISCQGNWSACVSNWQTYTITRPAANGGTPCPATNGQGSSCAPACDSRNGTLGQRTGLEVADGGQIVFLNVWCCAGRLPYPGTCGVSAGTAPGAYVYQELVSYYQTNPPADSWTVTCNTTWVCTYDCNGICN